MNVRHPMGVLHSFSIKNIFHEKMDLMLLFFVWRNIPLTCHIMLILPCVVLLFKGFETIGYFRLHFHFT